MTDEQEAPAPSGTPMVATSNRSGPLGDPKAKERVAKAAEAVGLSTEELVNLVVDTGLLAMAPSDGITKTYTLKDLGHKLWVEMNSVLTTNRAKWFKQLATQQRKALTVALVDRGFSYQTVANELGVAVSTVAQAWNEFADDLGAQVVSTRLSTIAGNLQLMAKRAQEMAINNDDYKALWKIENEFTKTLQSMGIVDRAIHRVEHTLKVDANQEEINAMLDLERKQRVRHEELKLIEAEVHDDVPDDMEID